MRNKKTQELVLLAILTALTLVLAHVHMPTLSGFVTLLDVGVFFTAFYLGKKEGAIVGGLSGLLIDFLLGYPQWAFFSLLFHGAQGYFAGWTGKKRFVGLFLSTLSMVGGYYLASRLYFNDLKAIESVLSNSMQNFVGMGLGFALVKLVERRGAIRYVTQKD
ncbi:ECF transporter S component [Streptococcus suis]|uniref:ECF transporter S component n=1 Tax=Streptococcus suis TaxID=1307 RepID=UPI001931F8D8|nr:ECF transporter S component [Streptococcus suis]MBM0195532.1 ECF transporter S component [Streptococcus suis]MBM7317011.1 ECF transporter S component [Streptococcus suis]